MPKVDKIGGVAFTKMTFAQNVVGELKALKHESESGVNVPRETAAAGLREFAAGDLAAMNSMPRVLDPGLKEAS